MEITNSKIQAIKLANTYCPRSFQSDMKAQNQLSQPGKPAQKKKMKMSINVPSLEAELQMFIFYQSHKSNIHTDENSKARGYIRNNCETQSTHCRIPLHYLISQNNQKKKCAQF